MQQIKLNNEQAAQILETMCSESMKPYKAMYVTSITDPLPIKYRAYTCVPGTSYYPDTILEWSIENLTLERKDIDSYNFRLTKEYEGLVFTFKGKSFALNVEYDPPTQKLHMGKLLLGSVNYE